MRRRYRYNLVLLLLGVLLFGFTRSQAPRCCSSVNGSCRVFCERISLVTIANSREEQNNMLQKLNDFCSRSLLVPFWECLNKTLQEIHKGDGWLGRPCCHHPQSERCRIACLQAQSVLELSTSCRHSDEISFFTCLEKQEAGEKCCINAQNNNCYRACKDVFISSLTPSKQVREAALNSCSPHSPRVIQCIHNYTYVTPADNPSRNLHCCDKSPNSLCRSTCKTILRTETIGQEIVDSLTRGGCGSPLPQDRLWQCFLTNSATNNEPGGSRTQSEKVGMDSAKLQCCFRAATVNCQRLCIETFSNQWAMSWNDFDRLCQYQLAESEMIRCLAEVEEPCELGCEGLSYCTNFNHRPTELFRSCDVHADRAAQKDVQLWEKGVIHLPQMTIPVVDITKCHPEIWKAIACALQIKPCHQQVYVNMICKSDCIDILSKCVDKSRLASGQTSLTICEALSPPGNNTPCISLIPYLEESKYAQSAIEVTHPCKPNPCNTSDVCMVNRNCLFGEQCYPYVCVPGCRMGDMSQLIVPRNSHVRLPSNTHGPRCQMVCYCNQQGVLEDCMTKLCITAEKCIVNGKKYNHNTRFLTDCNTCFCYAGEVTCSQKQCGSGLPCNCPDHYVPVCGANGKTYPSACLARCVGLTDDQFEFGACYDSDPCSPNSCHPYHRCVPKKRVCLSIRHRSCKQYDCVNMQHNCNQQPKFPVCDTDNVEHSNICWMLQRKKSLAHYGKCMNQCRSNGLVCGHNGETYASECAAWAERVSVDYKGPCAAVGSSYGFNSRCSGIKCSPLPSEHCNKVFPPGGCCPICGAAIRLLYSQKLSDWSVEVVRDVEPVVVQTIAEELRDHVKVTECEVFAYLSLESDIVVLFTTITDNPTLLQVEACVREAEKLEALIQQHSPNLVTELPLSFVTTAIAIDPVTDFGFRLVPSGSLALLLVATIFSVQRIL